ncbi:MAG TPA: desulfoferrodoxin family protein [Steroidobacteraceae bacterium]|nr:desulfoferrodoxin family protein [Steroidobacteraceae bacterium]
MRRRDFTTSALVGMAAAAALPAASKAEDSADSDQNVLFSGSDVGHWGSAVAAKHVPLVTVTAGTVSIKTPHPQHETHYIVSHTVVLADGKFLSRKTFSYKDAPVSEHPLPAGYTGKVTITSTCNLHDIWKKTVTV